MVDPTNEPSLFYLRKKLRPAKVKPPIEEI